MLTDHINLKQSEMLSLYTVVMKYESVYSGCIKPNDHIYKALLERLTSDKFQ